MFQINPKLFEILFKKNIISKLTFEALIKYLCNNRGRNCLDKWSTQKLSFSHMSDKWINVMILIIPF